ncbi:MAG: strawberry notch-like NTP hydrolase domain-containing protein [Trichloromonadaceae bacterium]
MAKKPSPDQLNLFDDWFIVNEPVGKPQDIPTVSSDSVLPEEGNTVTETFEKSRHVLSLRLAEALDKDGEITSKILTEEANRAFGGTQAEGAYSSKDSYDAMEAAFNIHLSRTESVDWNNQGGAWARNKAEELTRRIQTLPTQTRRDEEMDEFQQFSTPPALSFVANWVANVKASDEMMDPSAGTGDLAIWAKISGAKVILNELSQRRIDLLGDLFPDARLFKENAEQLDNVLPIDAIPSVIVMNPPFSSTAGRVQGQRDTSNGARHIEQALKRLETGGRLVAIVGNGMAMDRPAFSSWWGDIKKKYNVRANIGISGKEYAKYGTTFDNQILVIDKNGPTTQPVLTGRVESVADLPTLLEEIRDERHQVQRDFVKPAVKEDPRSIQDPLQPINGPGGPGAGQGGTGTESVGNGADPGTPIAGGETGGDSPVGNVVNDGIGTGGRVQDGPGGNVGGSSGPDPRGNSRVIEGGGSRSVTVEAKKGETVAFSDSVFTNYSPQRLTIPGAQQHPGKLVQSAAMSAVEPPSPTYAPVLPANLIQEGLLSIAQLEAVVYAGQAHSERLPNGSRKGFFIGDGTGVGKGREISGIILDNMMQGRKKAVWVSFNEGLIEDARRDFAGIGGDPAKIFFQGKTKAGSEITQTEGILFTTYSTLRGGERKQANDLGQEAGKTRAQQIVEWLGKDFDGVIAFDEAHSMGNAIAIKGKRGVRKPSQQAIAGINLQRELEDARVAYVSATGATELSNLSYADRLGLWGEGTPFADVSAFIGDVSRGGIASMELISRDMKALGMYISRSLSYDGVTYERLEHELSEFQEDVYNELAGAWQVVLSNVDEALDITQAGKNGNAKSAALSQFWGAHQRFFNQVITAMQTPCVIDDMRRQIEAGNVAVIQLVNTNEAAQERIIAEAAANDAALEDLDFTPRQMLMDYVRNGFPVAAYEESVDANGNTVFVAVRDSEGNQVFDREAIALRDSLLETLQQIRVPENPLDSIINAFGSDVVAEVTGRSRRFVQTRDDEGNLKIVEEKRGKTSSRADAAAFQNNKKDILVFSGAGGTGYSFHADNTAENQRKRIHYILQPGWRADGAVQGFGRTHRTNQANEPHYVLPTTNLKAQKRFVSSIARRLDQLGALTRGQREATSQGMFTASDNLESEYASSALKNFFSDLYRGVTDLSFQDVSKQMGLNLLDENASLSESKIPGIPQFLNRLLSLKTDMQNAVFGEFEKRLIEAVEYAKQHGLYDVGLQTMTALSIQKTRDDVAFEDKNTGAQTRYVELAVTNKIEYTSWEDAKNIAESRRRTDDLSGWFVSEYGKNKGVVFFLADIGDRIGSDGHSVRRGVIHTIKAHSHKYIDNADDVSRGYDYRHVTNYGRTSYEKVIITRAINEAEAEKLWKEQVAIAPKTETKTERMIVGVILPIWDRVEGSETIKRLQTDDGEQLLGRMLGAKAAKQTLKNLGLNSGLSNMTATELFNAVKNGNKAILANGWEIATAKVNFEDRIEIKGRSTFTDAEKRGLKEQGAFIERISWSERVFIPSGDNGIGIFERITASKPVVDLIGKSTKTEIPDEEQDYGIPKVAESENSLGVFSGEPDANKVSIDKVPILMDSQGGPSMAKKSGRSNTEKKPFHETVAETLIEQLKQGTAPWQKPWEPGDPGFFIPTNPTTGKRYRGINAIHLMSQGRTDQRWMTYKQAAAVGAQVNKGEKSTPIQYWQFTKEQDKLDANGRPVLDAQGKPVREEVRLERPRVFFAAVFNAEQIDGLPPLQRKEGKEQTWSAIERAEHILKASGANIQHGQENRAFYRPLGDSIHLPDKEQFHSANNYYATALHELGHWTGHSSRLDRDLSNPFGSQGYAKEELRAEIASMILGAEIGTGHDPGQHAAYVGSWIKVLQEDPLEIFRAAADAEKIQDYVLAFEQQQVQEQVHAKEGIMQQPELSQQNKSLSDIDQARNLRQPHEMVRAEFEALATVEKLENHGRKFLVTLGDRYAAFSDAESPSLAIADVHRGAVNNVLFKERDKGSWFSVPNKPLDIKDEVLDEYPDLRENYWDAREIMQEGEMQGEDGPTPDPREKSLDQDNADEALIADALRKLRNPPEAAEEQPPLQNPQPAQPAKTYLDAPYKDKGEVQALGGRWDRQEKSWYVPAGVDPSPFAKWAKEENAAEASQPQSGTTQTQTEQQTSTQERQYLAVPYGERDAAKVAGALWDTTAKSWYAGANADMAKLQRWMPENVPVQQEPAMPPREEFAEALRSIGCVVSGEHPIMDGKKHRISVEGERFSEKAGAGFYVGHLDGHPAGYIKNNQTGIEMKWKSKGYVLDPEQKAKLQAEAAEKLQTRAANQERLYEQTAQRVRKQMVSLVPVTEPTTYMQAKGIEALPGIYTDREGQTTYVPATDSEGKQWTMQYIQEDGTKRFAKDSRKEGCFHVVGGLDALAKAPALVIGEGYATASSLSKTLGFAVVAAFDSGNLPAVAEALHKQYPDKPVVIAGDDDKDQEIKKGINPGRRKAEEAAKAVGGVMLLPIFAPGEQSADPKGFSDFNDLATKSALGQEGIERQVRPVVHSAIELRKVQKAEEQKQERLHQQEQRPRRTAKI